jgi:hypothetical protein
MLEGDRPSSTSVFRDAMMGKHDLTEKRNEEAPTLTRFIAAEGSKCVNRKDGEGSLGFDSIVRSHQDFRMVMRKMVIILGELTASEEDECQLAVDGTFFDTTEDCKRRPTRGNELRKAQSPLNERTS